MSHAYTEDHLVEQPAIGLVADLGGLTVSTFDEVFAVGGTLGQETKDEAVLVPRLRTALERLNPSTRSHSGAEVNKGVRSRFLQIVPGIIAQEIVDDLECPFEQFRLIANDTGKEK
jgi:hypothetical protein